MDNEKCVRLYQQKANKATRGHTREMYGGFALLGQHSIQAELERQLQEELRSVEHEKTRKPDFYYIYQGYVKPVLQGISLFESFLHALYVIY